jgi:hypothetical protein
MMKYPFDLFMIVAAADRDEANQIATEIGNGENERNTYATELTPLDSNETVDYACWAPASQAMVSKCVAAMLAGRLPSIRYFMMNASNGALLDTNVPAALVPARWGEVWTFEKALEALGRKRKSVEVL